MRIGLSVSSGVFAFAIALCLALIASMGHAAEAPSPQPRQTDMSLTGERLKDFLERQPAAPEVQHELQILYPKLKAGLRSGNGWLLYVETFLDENNKIHSGRSAPILILAQGRTPNEAAVSYYLSNTLEVAPPSGMLFDDKQSYLVWAIKAADELVFSRIPYPFSRITLDTGSQAAGLELSGDKTETALGQTPFIAAHETEILAALWQAQAEAARLQKMLVRVDEDAHRLATARQALQDEERHVDRLTAAREQRRQELSAQLARDRQRVQAAAAQIQARQQLHPVSQVPQNAP